MRTITYTSSYSCQSKFLRKAWKSLTSTEIPALFKCKLLAFKCLSGFILLAFTKYWCFRELLRWCTSTILIMLSPTMNTDILDFWELVGFWDGGGGLSLALPRGSSLLIQYMTQLIYIWEWNFCIGQICCSILTYLNNTINLHIFHSAFFLC